MKTTHIYSILIGAVGALFFLPFLGGVHLFDWDEINFAECSREMLLLDNYLRVHIDFEPFWEKPPFFFWLQAMSMKLFGVGEYAARFPNAVCGVITLILLFQIGTKLHDLKFGLLWAGAYFGSLLPHFYFKSGIIDPWFNLWIFLGIYFFILSYWKKEGMDRVSLSRKKLTYVLLSGVFIGLAILTKGPAAYIIACLTLFGYWIYQRFRFYVGVGHFLLFTLGALSVTFAWLGVETIINGPWFLVEFITYQYRLFVTPDAGHGGFFGYHVVVLLVGCFPASIFSLRAFFRQPEGTMPFRKDFRIWMIILFWVVLILFSIVKSKIIHYSSLAYFPITYLAALTLYQILQKEIRFSLWMRAGLLSLGTLIGAVAISAPFIGQHIEILKPLLAKDPFAIASLDADVIWTGWEALAGVFFILILWGGVWLMTKDRIQSGLATLFGGVAVFLMLGLVLFIGKIEKYSQESAISFLESIEGEDAYVEVIGYKSYAQLFYTKKKPHLDTATSATPTRNSGDIWARLKNFQSPERRSKTVSKKWLLHGDIDKDAYFVTKINKVQMLEGVDGLEKIGEKNGFVFFKRNKTR